MVNHRQLSVDKKIHAIVKSESTKRNESMKSLVQYAIIEYFDRHKFTTGESHNDSELEELYDFFEVYIKKHVYFTVKSLAIEFLINNESLTYEEASNSKNLRRIKYKFSKITTNATQQKILTRYNKRTFRVIGR